MNVGSEGKKELTLTSPRKCQVGSYCLKVKITRRQYGLLCFTYLSRNNCLNLQFKRLVRVLLNIHIKLILITFFNDFNIYELFRRRHEFIYFFFTNNSKTGIFRKQGDQWVFCILIPILIHFWNFADLDIRIGILRS